MMKGAGLFYGSSFTSSCMTTPRCSQGLCTCCSNTLAREQKFCKHSNRYGWAEGYPRELSSESLSKGCSATWVAVCCMTVLLPSEVKYQQTSLAVCAGVYYSSVPPEIVISDTASIRENGSLWWASHRDPSGTEPVPHVWQVLAVRLPCLQGNSGWVLLFCYSPDASNSNSGVFARGSPGWYSYAQIAGRQG